MLYMLIVRMHGVVIIISLFAPIRQSVANIEADWYKSDQELRVQFGNFLIGLIRNVLLQKHTVNSGC